MGKNELKRLRKDLKDVARGVRLAGRQLNEGRLYKMPDTVRDVTGLLNKLSGELNDIIEQQSSNV
ncbi:TPA: hypothetical protein JC757_002849 [Salmonella enterica subsp. diarizonae]|nr:hypothetical protein [Salmonella enterica subsp. diarizonae]